MDPDTGDTMLIKEIMTADPACCTPETTARDVARLMRERDCGAIPVVDSREGRRPIGMVTDRDLAVRGLADDRGPDTPVRDLMTERPHTARADDEIETVRQVMMQQKVRRVPVTDANGAIIGIVAQADLARHDDAVSDRELGKVVEAISEPGR
jgi:CBS domain-containing protein